MTELPKLQHYVPQLLLRRFAFGKRQQVHVFDKREGKTFVAAINKTGAQRGYYNVPVSVTRQVIERVRHEGTDVAAAEHVVLSLEPALESLESRTAKVIERIVRKESLGGLSNDDRAILAYFATVQFLRVPHRRDMYHQLVDSLRERVGAMLEDMEKDVDGELKRAGLGPVTPDDEAQMHLRHLIEAPSFMPYFLKKDWLLQRAPAGDPLYISDNPVTLWNHGARGESFVRGFGLGTLKSEIAMPLSPRLCLTIVCPTILEESRRTLATVAQLRAAGVRGAEEETARVREFVEAADAGHPLDLSHANVEHLNSRQVHMASRYLYGSDGRFALARKMLADDPSMCAGPRVMVG
jgi:hypothetical protein